MSTWSEDHQLERKRNWPIVDSLMARDAVVASSGPRSRRSGKPPEPGAGDPSTPGLARRGPPAEQKEAQASGTAVTWAYSVWSDAVSIPRTSRFSAARSTS